LHNYFSIQHTQGWHYYKNCWKLHCSSPFGSTMRLVRITLSYSSQGRMSWRSKSWCLRSLSNKYRCVKIPNPSMYEWYVLIVSWGITTGDMEFKDLHVSWGIVSCGELLWAINAPQPLRTVINF
jgi:hypothetical protein